MNLLISVISARIRKSGSSELLKEGQEKGYISGNLPTDPQELSQLAERIQREMVYEQSGEGEIGDQSGRQQIILKRQPNGEWNERTDRRLPLFLEGPEWSALFRDVLHVQRRDLILPGEAMDEWSERQKIKFKESIADYPMLGRVWDTYIDVAYQPEEIRKLHDECLRVKSSTSNAVAVRGLDKLIAGCEEASKIGAGLLLLSD